MVKIENIILDGEMIAYSEEDGFLPFGSLRSVARNYRTDDQGHDEDEVPAPEDTKKDGLAHPCFIAFDVIHVQNDSFQNHPLYARRKALHKTSIERKGWFEHVKYDFHLSSHSLTVSSV